MFFSRLILTAGALFTFTMLAEVRSGSPRTALDEYVAKPDPAFRYEVVKTVNAASYNAWVLSMTSQTWLTEAEVDRPLWRHWVTIVKPHKAEPSAAMLIITGGSNTSDTPRANIDPVVTTVATATNSVLVELRMVPNQPLTFTGDPEKQARTEDSIIAYGLAQYVKSGDPKWIARLPMTKGAVRAMDAASAFLASPEGGGMKIDKYFVAGASKRGWTTWTTGAVDSRVIGVAPLVIDVLNFHASVRHHWRSYGFWAPAIGDYHELLNTKLGHPRLREAAKIEDPYEYRERLAAIPKYVINAAGDQYFLPDSWQFYFPDLKGEKYLRYVPNADHSLKNTDAVQSLAVFYQAVMHGKPRPKFSWEADGKGTIRVRTVDKPAEVKLWWANNPAKRDFRLESIGPAYQSRVLEANAAGEYVAEAPAAEKGWTAYFVEMTFPSGVRFPFKFTTGVYVTPNTLPFPEPKANR